MKAFADWVSKYPFRLWLLAILFVFLPPPISPALLALNVLRHGARSGVTGAAIVLGVLLGISLTADATAAQIAIVNGLLLLYLLPPVLGSVLLAHTRSLSLAYQGTLIGSVLGVFLLVLLVPEIAQLGALTKADVLTLARELAMPSQVIGIIEELAEDGLTRLLLFYRYALAIGAWLLGFWWFSLVRNGIGFGEHFRALRLGRLAGILLMAVLMLAQIVPFEPLRLLAPLALAGFLFIGLAVMHARVHSDSWPVAVPILVYVFLLFPFTSMVVVLGLSTVGLLDNFFALRGRSGSGD